MSSLLIGCSALETSAPGATAGPSWWERLARRIANEYRIRRAEREVAAWTSGRAATSASSTPPGSVGPSRRAPGAATPFAGRRGRARAARTFPASSRRCPIEAIEHRHWWPMSRASILQSSAA